MVASQDSNLQAVNRKSDALPIAQPHHITLMLTLAKPPRQLALLTVRVLEECNLSCVYMLCAVSESAQFAKCAM